ncbi:MAG: beta-lactamase family protein [Gemmatimonadetes bacterium]|nr:beta-lactamase family protein [Gemmatimonadota bacterium]
MLRMIGYAGPWAVPLVILTLVVAGLIVRALLRAGTPEAVGSRNAILFWGFVAAVLGFLGQCSALYRATSVVVTAPELSPEIVAEGFALSFVPTLWGGGILLLSGLAWVALPRLRRGRTVGVALLIAAVLTQPGCAGPSTQGPQDITQGVWVGGGGLDQFLFDLRGEKPDSLVGVVHVMHGGRMDSEVTITRASFHDPDLEMFMAPTNATYRGQVDLANGRIRGGLSFSGEPGPDMELRWTDPSALAGFPALPGDQPYTYQEPKPGGDGWEVASPGEVGLDPAALDSLVNAIARGEAGLIHSLLVVRNGKLVLEEYFHGYTADDLHRLASTTKSVSALLVGAALDRGLIESLETPLLGYFPGVSPGDEAWSEETLDHLLTMSMGLDWSEAEAESVHGTGEAFFRKVLSRRVADPPGTRWAYVNANVNLLAGVIFKATGKHAEAFAAEALFTPLDISSWDWTYGKEGGYELMDGSLQLRPRDLAKIGTMVGQEGRWQGRQIVGEEWIREFTRSHFQTGMPLSGYGDLWWLGDLPARGGEEPMIVANGWGSQFIVIFPRLDMVVVTTGGNEDNGMHWALGDVLARYLPSPT